MSDLRVVRWADDNDAGIAAVPDRASKTCWTTFSDGPGFDRGDVAELLRMACALCRLAAPM